jgi:hypothetical protein
MIYTETFSQLSEDTGQRLIVCLETKAPFLVVNEILQDLKRLGFSKEKFKYTKSL